MAPPAFPPWLAGTTRPLFPPGSRSVSLEAEEPSPLLWGLSGFDQEQRSPCFSAPVWASSLALMRRGAGATPGPVLSC